MTQLDPDGRRAKWIEVLLEYDLEIKPTKLIKGQVLAKLMAKSNYDALDLNQLDIDASICTISEHTVLPFDFLASSWYKDIIFVLYNLQALEGLTKNQARSVKLKSIKYCIINGFLYWKDLGGILLNCLLEKEAQEKIREFHQGDYGGNLYWKVTTHKILRASFIGLPYFLMCIEKFQLVIIVIFEGRRKLIPLPLKTIFVESPFQQWGIDFIGDINPDSFNQRRWILTTTAYFSKWVEAIPVKYATYIVAIQFLINNILSKFGCPKKLVTDNAKAFYTAKMIKLCVDYNIVLAHSTTYYPQGNGLAKSSNKILVKMITKLLQDNKREQKTKLKFALWEDRISTKRALGTSPFQLVYCLDVGFPSSLGLPVMKYLQEQESEINAIQRRINQLIKVHQIKGIVYD